MLKGRLLEDHSLYFLIRPNMKSLFLEGEKLVSGSNFIGRGRDHVRQMFLPKEDR